MMIIMMLMTMTAACQPCVRITVCNELRKVMFLMQSVCVFLVCYEISRGIAEQICAKFHTEDVFDLSLG